MKVAAFALLIILFLMGMVVSPFIFFALADNRQEREWKEFSAAHHCRITRYPQGWDEHEKTWTCDDGLKVFEVLH